MVGSLKTVATELAKYNSDLVAIQEVKLDNGGSEADDVYIFFHRDGNVNHHI